jgi:hypothetical protein
MEMDKQIFYVTQYETWFFVQIEVSRTSFSAVENLHTIYAVQLTPTHTPPHSYLLKITIGREKPGNLKFSYIQT